MFCRNVDFIAVFVITLCLLALPEISSLRTPVSVHALTLQSAPTTKNAVCPIASRVYSLVAYHLHR